jgi:polysaccharide biosynthesis protein PslH
VQPPKVLGIVGFRVFPDLMGGQKHIANYYRALSKHTQLVLCLSNDNDEPTIVGVPSYRFLFNHWKGLFNIFNVWRLSKIIRSHNIDILLLDHSYFGWLGFLLQKLTNKPFVIKSANIEFQRFKEINRPFWFLYKHYEKWVHRKAAHNFFITAEDRALAIKDFELQERKTTTLPYFLYTTKTVLTKEEARNTLIHRYKLAPSTLLFYFNGTLDYTPNVDALYRLVNTIIPLLHEKKLVFKIFITGNRISNQLKSTLQQKPDIIYEGYVTDTALYHLGTDCFICMLTSSTGVKTKIVEALGYGQKVISTKIAANGFYDINWGHQFQLVDHTNMALFAEKMASIEINNDSSTPTAFYEKHDPSRIIKDSLLSLQHAVQQH